MYYAKMRRYDVANGPGIRTTLFVSGCKHNCPGCFNKEAQSFKFGEPWSQKDEEDFLSFAKDPYIQGVTILGGEPMDQIMDDDLLRLLTRIKKETNQSIWIYSGYTYEEILGHPKRLELLRQCDVLVDGKFIIAEKDLRLHYRGSRNQRIVDVKTSLETGMIKQIDFTSKGEVA